MKTLSISLFFLLNFAYSSCAMNSKDSLSFWVQAASQKRDEKTYKNSFSCLSLPLKRFVEDYKNWSKEEQDKIHIKLTLETKGEDYSPLIEIMLHSPLTAAHKYNNDVQSFLIGNIWPKPNIDLSILFYVAINAVSKHDNHKLTVT